MGRGHFTAITIAGMMGFFTNAYNLVTLPPNVSAAVNGVTLCGTFAGQLFLSWLDDKLSRKKVYRITLALTVFSSLASGLSLGHALCFFRFWLGFGIGGDYPLSASIMSNESTRGVYIASVFAVQGLGILAAAVVSIIASHVPQTAADNVWRIILMSGAVPAALTFYLRMRLPETARYTVAFTDHLGLGRRRFFIQLLGLGVFFMTLFRFNVDDIPFVFISFFFPNIHTIHKYWLSWDERCIPVAMAFPQLGERAPPQTLAHLNSLMISRLRIMRSETQQGFKPKSPFFFLAVVNYIS